MDFVYFTQFQHYVTACYVTSIIGIIGLCMHIILQNKKQKRRLKILEAKIAK